MYMRAERRVTLEVSAVRCREVTDPFGMCSMTPLPFVRRAARRGLTARTLRRRRVIRASAKPIERDLEFGANDGALRLLIAPPSRTLCARSPAALNRLVLVLAPRCTVVRLRRALYGPAMTRW